MEYTEQYQLKLPQTTDDVDIGDINDNTQQVENLFLSLLPDSDTIQAVWGSDSPSEATINAAIAKLAQSTPVTMGEEGDALMVTDDGVAWTTPVRIATVTYVGTGDTGVSIALPFDPTFVYILPYGTISNSTRVTILRLSDVAQEAFGVAGSSCKYTGGISYVDGVLTVTTSDVGSWYCNASGNTYICVCFG